MKKTLLFSAALLAPIAASAQTIVWPSSVNRETKEANVSAIVTGSESITATDITPGADIKIGDKDGANAVTAVKNTTGENLQFPSETEGMISWRPINGNVDGAEATADLAEGAGAYIDFTIEEGDIEKTLAGMSSFEFDVTKVGTDAIRINVKLIGEGDTNVDTGWLINADNAKSFGDEYQADYDAEAKNKDNPWDEAANGYNPSRNDGSKGVSGGANANGISHVKLAVPAEFAASNPYKVTLRIAIIKCANNKDLAVNAVTFNFGGSDTPVASEVWTIAGVGTMMGSSWDTADATNDLKSTDGKIYTLVKEGVVLEKGVTYEYKAAKDHAWTESYPSSNATLTVEETGTYTIIFTFNSETKELTAKAEKTGEATIGEKTYSVIGTINGNWDNDTYMDGANGLYMAMFPDVKAGTYEFKVRVDGKWDEAYPSSNYKLELEKDANVAVLFNSETKEVSVEIVKTTIGAEDNTTVYLGDHSMLIPLSELGGGCNIKFTNYSSKANNWNNWVAVITNNYAEPFAEGAIKIALRADNWENIQWSNEGITSNFNWDTFMDDMDGSTVEMTVDRAVNGDVKIHADITTAAGTKYFEEFTKNLGTEEALYFCLSVDGSHLELLPVDDPTAIQSAKAQAKAGIRYNLAGQKVDANYKGIVIENGKKFMVK